MSQDLHQTQAASWPGDPHAQSPEGQTYQGPSYQGQTYQGQTYQGQTYPAQGYPGQPYPVGPTIYRVGPVEHPQTQAIFILGILGIVTAGICSYIAWYMGAQAKKEIEAGAPYPWAGNLKTGYLLGKIGGIVHLCVLGLSVVFFVLYFIFVAYLLSKTGG